MLTVDELKSMPPNHIFATGYGMITHPWFNQAKNVDSKRQTPVKWVAVRGGIHDWCIYHSMDGNLCHADFFDSYDHLATPWERVYRHGAKLYDQVKIREFIPCTEEAFELYRF